MELTEYYSSHKPRKEHSIMELINLNQIQDKEEWISKGRGLHERWKAFVKAIAKLTGVVGSLFRWLQPFIPLESNRLLWSRIFWLCLFCLFPSVIIGFRTNLLLMRRCNKVLMPSWTETANLPHILRFNLISATSLLPSLRNPVYTWHPDLWRLIRTLNDYRSFHKQQYPIILAACGISYFCVFLAWTL